jgi:hypothetical protein
LFLFYKLRKFLLGAKKGENWDKRACRMEMNTFVASSNLSIGTLACEAGCVVDDDETALGQKETKASVRTSCIRAHHSRLMDTVRASLVFLISLPLIPSHGLLLHSVPRPAPILRLHQRLAAKPAHTVSSLHSQTLQKTDRILPVSLFSTTQYVARKAQPIKRVDSEPLWRKDIQYDFLYYIFSDKTRAFVDYQAPDRPVVNFCDLYVNALYNSPKCSKVLKDKMVETPAFAIEFAKISLLTNVGRINTTMACPYFFSLFFSPSFFLLLT